MPSFWTANPKYVVDQIVAPGVSQAERVSRLTAAKPEFGEAGIEERLCLGDVVAEDAGDIADGDACCSLRVTPASASSRPSRSTQIRSDPFAMISVTVRSTQPSAAHPHPGRD